jgi:hypothetical protein
MSQNVSFSVPAQMEIPVTVERQTVSTISVDVSAFPAATLSYIFDYGLRQVLNDAKAGENVPENAKAKMEKRLAKLLAGEMGTRSGSGAGSADPIEHEATLLSRKVVAQKMRAAGIKKPSEHADFDKLVAQYATQPHVIEAARIRVETTRNMAAMAATIAPTGGGINLAALGLAGPDEAGSGETAE